MPARRREMTMAIYSGEIETAPENQDISALGPPPGFGSFFSKNVWPVVQHMADFLTTVAILMLDPIMLLIALVLAWTAATSVQRSELRWSIVSFGVIAMAMLASALSHHFPSVGLSGMWRDERARASGAGYAPCSRQDLREDILAGRNLHDALSRLAASMVSEGTDPRDVQRHLFELMDASTCPRDDRWRDRRRSIPRYVTSALEGDQGAA